jgi:hypothetical protein
MRALLRVVGWLALGVVLADVVAWAGRAVGLADLLPKWGWVVVLWALLALTYVKGDPVLKWLQGIEAKARAKAATQAATQSAEQIKGDGPKS